MTTSKWISSFVKTKSNSLILEIPMQFIEEKFNHRLLNQPIENISSLVKRITSDKICTDSPLNKKAIMLYLYLHQRYVLTLDGLKSMNIKYKKGIYGKCIKPSCRKNKLIPVGLSDTIGDYNMRLYCFKCCSLLESDEKIDGAAFGVNFCEFLRIKYRLGGKCTNDHFFPKLFGFDVFYPEKQE